MLRKHDRLVLITGKGKYIGYLGTYLIICLLTPWQTFNLPIHHKRVSKLRRNWQGLSLEDRVLR